jgi:hypothetical protein
VIYDTEEDAIKRTKRSVSLSPGTNDEPQALVVQVGSGDRPESV